MLTLERHVLISAKIGHEGHDVGAVVYRSVHGFRELSLAAVATTALDLHQKVVYDLRLYREGDVNLLSSGRHCGGVHIKRLAAYGADRYRLNIYFDPIKRGSDISAQMTEIEMQKAALQDMLDNKLPLDDDNTVKRLYR